MPQLPKSRVARFSVAAFAILAIMLGSLVAYDLNWMRNRREARQWLATQPNSWYAPSLVGAKMQASPPWMLSLWGEQGVVGIGLDVNEFAGPAPYSESQLRSLFPPARVDWSRGGVWVAKR
jgi:hypothetical protein